MVTLPQVPEEQEETVWRVLEIRCQELMQHDEEERKQSVHVDEPTRHTDSNHQSVNSHTTNLLGCKKTPKVVPPSAVASAQNVVDFANLAKEVSPRYTNAVVVASRKVLTLAAFNTQRKVNSEMGHDWQGCSDHRLEKTVASFYKHEGQSQLHQFSKSSFVYVSVTHYCDYV